MLSRRLSLLLSLVLLAGGCQRSSSNGERAIGKAFVGPVTMPLRKELAVGAPAVGNLAHGTPVEILQIRRRWVKIRDDKGLIGWTDTNKLLTPAQMENLRKLAAEYAKLPSQGRARIYAALNVHTEPHRQSPSFYQIPEHGFVELIGRRVVARESEYTAEPLMPPVTPKPKVTKKPKVPKTPPPPRPEGPKLPANWEELSQAGAGLGKVEEGPRELSERERLLQELRAKPALRLEDWALIRLKDGRVGWVLMGPLVMDIPDEVAQYAEGHRISSFFKLGSVMDDEKGEKGEWLWTTLTTGGKPEDFDGFRVFWWNRRRHRYETSYIERNVFGRYPVVVQQREGESPQFTVTTKDGEGAWQKRTFVFEGGRVRLLSKEAAPAS